MKNDDFFSDDVDVYLVKVKKKDPPIRWGNYKKLFLTAITVVVINSLIQLYAVMRTTTEVHKVVSKEMNKGFSIVKTESDVFIQSSFNMGASPKFKKDVFEPLNNKKCYSFEIKGKNFLYVKINRRSIISQKIVPCP